MTLRLYTLAPSVIFKARVDQSSFAYPLSVVGYDTIIEGSWPIVQDNMTVLFGTADGDDDLGRQRVRDGATASSVGLGRCSQGIRDGEVNLQDDAYITILDDHRVWTKIPWIDTDGTIYKDSDLAVSDRTTEPPPVSNAGAYVAGTIDSGTNELQVTLPHEANTSFATASGASISTYLWSLPTGVVLDSGATSDSQITVNCDPGFYWIRLRVTDDNGKTHDSWVAVYARDPDSDTTINAFNIVSHKITPQGQQISIKIFEDIAEGTYPDGTLVMLWEDEPSGPTDRSHMIFIGWHNVDPTTISGKRTGILKDTTFTCLDVAGKLDKLGQYTQEVADADTPADWTQMVNPNIDLYLHYLMQWHTTVLTVADWTDSGTGSAFPFVILGSDGESMFDQVNQRANSMVPDYQLTCNRLGQLKTLVDPMLQDSGDRTATVQDTLSNDDWSDIRFTHQRSPRIRWHRGNAIKASQTTIAAMFCIAPGEAPGQGELDKEWGEQLAQNQTDLNSCEGHRYARINAPESRLRIILAEGDDKDLEPADMTWLRLTIGSDYAGQRGLSFTNERGLIHEINIRYNHVRTGLTKTVEILWERETEGAPAVTYIPPPPEITDSDPQPEWDPGPLPWPIFSQGLQSIVGINTDGYLYQTTDYQTEAAMGGPTYNRVNLSLSGTPDSFVVDPFSPLYLGTGTDVNGWIATTTRIYYIEDLFSASPTVTSQHTFAYSVDRSGSKHRTILASFGNFFSGVAWLVCVSHYRDTGGHTGTWAMRSDDGGASWSSEVQITAHYDNSQDVTTYPGLYISPKTAGLVYASAMIATGADVLIDYYKSTDYGASWATFSNPAIDPGYNAGAIHGPWPDNAAETLFYYNYNAVGAGGAKLYRVNGATNTDISPQDGSAVEYGNRYDANFGVKTYDLNRRYVALAGLGFSGGSEYHAAFVSSDYGDSWLQIETEVIAGNPGPRSIAFAADTPEIAYLWGYDGYMAYMPYYGGSANDRSGNILADFPSISDFIGIAGG